MYVHVSKYMCACEYTDVPPHIPFHTYSHPHIHTFHPHTHTYTHTHTPSRSAIFTSNKLLVVVAELNGDEREALDVVPVITTALIDEHQLITGIVVVIDPGTIPINSRGEKQRVHLRDSFLADEVDPIYVAYNL